MRISTLKRCNNLLMVSLRIEKFHLIIQAFWMSSDSLFIMDINHLIEDIFGVLESRNEGICTFWWSLCFRKTWCRSGRIESFPSSCLCKPLPFSRNLSEVHFGPQKSPGPICSKAWKWLRALTWTSVSRTQAFRKESTFSSFPTSFLQLDWL